MQAGTDVPRPRPAFRRLQLMESWAGPGNEASTDLVYLTRPSLSPSRETLDRQVLTMYASCAMDDLHMA